MSEFTGPLFIVGMPRSGTKLLRDLMNQHPLISIPDVESHFVPGMVKQFGEKLQITTSEEKEQFYKAFRETSFFYNNVNKNRLLNKEEFISRCDFTDWKTVFRFIAIYYSKGDYSPGMIWGDKTPRYLKKVMLLTRIFPDARFIHIIRDPRDYCISQRKIWNKNIFRSAADWNSTMSMAMKYAGLLKKNYIEIYYEELTNNPQKVLSGICDFLNIKFTTEMLTIKKSNEFHGDAKGSKEIIINSKKYLSELTDDEIKKIESLTLNSMTHFGYEPLHKVKPAKLSKSEEMYYKLMDIWNMYWFYINEQGFIRATTYYFKLKRNNVSPE